MSTPGPAKRRRIAGERRPASVPGEPSPAKAPAAPPPFSSPVEPPGTRRDSAQPAPAKAPDGPLAAFERPDEPSTTRIGRATAIRLAVLAVLALVLVGAAAWLGLATYDVREVREAQQVDEALRSAPAAAERAAVSILSYSHTSLDADASAAKELMTPEYATTYGDTFDTLVKEEAGKLEAVVEADVRASGVTTASEDRSTVLLFVNQTTTSRANNGEPQSALNRVAMDLVRSGDEWLVADIRSY